jgi:hypothetical protein
MLMNIPEDVAQRLNQLAQQEGASVGDLLKSLLDRYTAPAPSGSLADMAHNARATGLTSGQQVDTAQQSREILNTEYADYLKQRMDKGGNGDSNG